mmetsp:Transcript_14021/g.22064  ORF Transcript_14021/g.22064 Transcript_14021/m.22064 type:complete len:508 (+) Transcript_14021:32-1555(+)
MLFPIVLAFTALAPGTNAQYWTTTTVAPSGSKDSTTGDIVNYIVLAFMGCLFLGLVILACYSFCPGDSKGATKLQLCCLMHVFLLLGMMVYGGLFLKDAFGCEKCLYFAVGRVQEDYVETHSNYNDYELSVNDQDPTALQVGAKGYTGTVQKILAKNSHAQFAEAADCGIWVVHPDQWQELGSNIEYNVQVGETRIGAAGAARVTNQLDLETNLEPLSAQSTSAQCEVNIGTDSLLRNTAEDNKEISEGECKKVRYVDDKVEDAMIIEMEGLVYHRGKFAIAGSLLFIALRLLQYFTLFMTLGSDASDNDNQQDDCCNLLVKCGKTVLQLIFAIFDYVFYTQFPLFVLEPLSGTSFAQDCDSILVFRFIPIWWIVAAVGSTVGFFVYFIDLCFLKNGCNKIGLVWRVVKFIVGAILTTLAVVYKFFQIMQYGFTMAFNIKLEWAFQFKFWPLALAVKLDMFQIFALLFIVWDQAFGIFANYYKYIADEDDRQEAAGIFGQAAKRSEN